MTQNELQRFMGHKNGGYFALAASCVQLAHSDIARFNRLYARYRTLPELTKGQKERLHKAAVESCAARDFLDAGWVVMWANEAQQ